MSGLALDTLSHSYIIHVRSKDCRELTEGYNTDLQINLEAEIKKTRSDQDLHISLSSAEIPVTFYNFSSNLDNLNIYVDGSPSLVITQGNYDIFELVDLITADGTFPYSASYNENTGKVTLTNTDASSHTINFSQENSRGLSKALGFERSDELVASGGSTSSDGVINLQTVHTIFLYSDLGSSNVITTEKGNFESIIEKIPIRAAAFEIINFNPYMTAPFTTVLSNDVISNFRLSLRDQNGKLVQLNDVRYELSLLVEVHNTKEIEPPPAPPGRRSEVAEIQNQLVSQVESRPQQTFSSAPVIPVQAVLPQLPPPQPQPQPQPPKPVVQRPEVVPEKRSQEQLNQDSELTDALLLATQIDLF